FMISWSRAAVGPVSFFGEPAAARGAAASPRAGTARAEAPTARARKDRREGAGAGAGFRVAGTSVVISGLRRGSSGWTVTGPSPRGGGAPPPHPPGLVNRPWTRTGGRADTG